MFAAQLMNVTVTCAATMQHTSVAGQRVESGVPSAEQQRAARCQCGTDTQGLGCARITSASRYMPAVCVPSASQDTPAATSACKTLQAHVHTVTQFVDNLHDSPDHSQAETVLDVSCASQCSQTVQLNKGAASIAAGVAAHDVAVGDSAGVVWLYDLRRADAPLWRLPCDAREPVTYVSWTLGKAAAASGATQATSPRSSIGATPAAAPPPSRKLSSEFTSAGAQAAADSCASKNALRGDAIAARAPAADAATGSGGSTSGRLSGGSADAGAASGRGHAGTPQFHFCCTAASPPRHSHIAAAAATARPWQSGTRTREVAQRGRCLCGAAVRHAAALWQCA